MSWTAPPEPEPPERMRVSPLSRPLDDEVETALRRNLGRCPDLAFALVAEVLVPDHQADASRVLFAWLRPEALRSIRSALNLVSAAVAASLPRDEFLDVVILNSAPEMLLEADRSGLLLAENDPAERDAALLAASAPRPEPAVPAPPDARPWWKLW